MSGILVGQYNFGPVETAKTPDRASIYVATGQQLNKQYYENRQAYLTNIQNPLSNIKSRKVDEGLLNNIRGRITEGASEFKENNDWSQAANYIYNASESIISNEGLKAILSSYQAEQQYSQELKESGWDTVNQSTFLMRSRYQSEAIDYDENENIVRSGGFYGVQIGQPIDLGDKMKQIEDIISKANASGSTSGGVNAQSAIVQGLAQVLNVDGQSFVSNYLETETSTEGVSYDRIAQYARQRLLADPEVTNYLRTVAENEGFRMRFVNDPTNPKGGYLRDFQPSDLSGVFQQSYVVNSLAGHGLTLSDIGTMNSKTGKFAINPNMSEITKSKIDLLNELYGIDLETVLTGGISSIPGDVQDSLQEFLNTGFNQYIEDNLDGYIQNIGLEDGANRSAYINQWYQNILSNDYIQNTANGFADGTAQLLSWQKTKSISKLVSNQTAFAKAWDAKIEEQNRPRTQFVSTPDIPVSIPTASEMIAQKQQIGESLFRVQKSIDEFAITSDDYRMLGLPINDTNAFKNIDLYSAINNTTDEQSRTRLLDLFEHQRNLQLKDSYQNQLRNQELDTQEAFNTFKSDPNKFRGIGRYGIASDRRLEIINNDLNTYDKYIEYARNKGTNITVQDSTGEYVRANVGDALIMSEDQYNKEISNIVENINVRSNRDNNGNSQLTSKASLVLNPSKSTTDYMNNTLGMLSESFAGLTVEYNSLKDKDTGIVINDDLRALLTRNVLYESVTTNSRGVSVTNRNEPFNNAEPIKYGGKQIYGIRPNVVYDPNNIDANGSNKFIVQFTLLGENGESIGRIGVSRPVDNITYNQLIQSDRNQALKYSMNDSNIIGDNVFQYSAGLATATATQAVPIFQVPNETNTLSGDNIIRVEQQLSSQPVDTPYYINVPINNIQGGYSMGNVTLEVRKVGAGQPGQFNYKARMVSKDNPSGNWRTDNVIDFGMGIQVPIQSLNGTKDFQHLSDALKELVDLSLNMDPSLAR